MAKPSFISVGIIAAVMSIPGSALDSVTTPRAAIDIPATGHREVAVFAGGCFWGVEGI